MDYYDQLVSDFFLKEEVFFPDNMVFVHHVSTEALRYRGFILPTMKESHPCLFNADGDMIAILKDEKGVLEACRERGLEVHSVH